MPIENYVVSRVVNYLVNYITQEHQVPSIF